MKNRKFLLAVLFSIASVFSFFLPASAEVPPPDDPSINHSAIALNISQSSVTPMVAASHSHTVGLRSDGTVIVEGCQYRWNNKGQCNVSDWIDIIQVAAGWYHTVGLKADGTVVATGRNTEGQCDVGHWTDIVQVAAGWYHTVGLKSDGTVVAMGPDRPLVLGVHDWTDIVQVAANRFHTVGLKSGGTVVVAGSSYGQKDVGKWTDIVQVAAGYSHRVGLKSDGTVVAMGSNTYAYEQCDGSGWTDVVQVAARYSHTVGLKSDGTVVAVGSNSYGQCNLDRWTDIVQVAAGRYHTVGLKYDGTVVAAGAGLQITKWNLEWNLGIITKSTLIISSTGGGAVISPSEGSFDYGAGTTVRLVAKPELGYKFVKWTGDIGAIFDINATTTTIVMTDDYSITADFEINWVLVGSIIAGAVLVILVILFFRTRGGKPS